jgi:hypothetical protein
MNERDMADRIRQMLDDSAQHLPYRVEHRLKAARARALQGMTEDRQAPEHAHARTWMAPSSRALSLAGPPGVGWRLSWIIAPWLIVVAGIVAIELWDQAESAEELADVDQHVLTDPVPISAYADRGFGVFLSNTRHEPR